MSIEQDLFFGKTRLWRKPCEKGFRKLWKNSFIAVTSPDTISLSHKGVELIYSANEINRELAPIQFGPFRIEYKWRPNAKNKLH